MSGCMNTSTVGIAAGRSRRAPCSTRRRARRSARNPARKRTTSSLPSSDGWKRKKPRSIQRCDPRAAVRGEHEQHQRERHRVDAGACSAGRRRGRASDTPTSPIAADGGVDRLPDDVVVGVARHVVARDPATTSRGRSRPAPRPRRAGSSRGGGRTPRRRRSTRRALRRARRAPA